MIAFAVWASAVALAVLLLARGLDEEVVPLGWGAPEDRDQSEYTAPVCRGPNPSSEGATSATEECR